MLQIVLSSFSFIQLYLPFLGRRGTFTVFSRGGLQCLAQGLDRVFLLEQLALQPLRYVLP